MPDSRAERGLWILAHGEKGGITEKSIYDELLQLVNELEKLPASEQATNCVVLCSHIRERITALSWVLGRNNEGGSF